MIADKTKCTIVKVPGEGTYAGLQGAACTATNIEGERKTGTQQFKLDSSGTVYGNGDSGFVVEAR